MGYVYLICDPSNDTFKIGVTRDLNSNRIKKLQTGNSTELFICDIYKCEYPFRLEKLLHSHYHNKHEYNEWFRLNAHDRVHFIELCKEKDEFIHYMLQNPFFAKDIR